MDDEFSAGKLYGRHTKVTRYLCAGVYLDRLFRDKVIRDVHNDGRHRVAPSYGFDLVPVVAHARRAWALDTAHQTALLATFAAGVLLELEATITALCFIAALPLAVQITRCGARVAKLKTRALWRGLWRRAPGDDQHLREQARRLLLSTLGILVVAAVPAVAANATGQDVSASLPRALIVFGIITALAAATAAARQFILNRLHRQTEFRPAKPSPRLRVIDRQQSSTLVVFSRAYSYRRSPTPFIGSGNVVETWEPRIVALNRKDSEHRGPADIPPFFPHELVDFLRKKAVEQGAQAHGPGLPGLYVRDRLFVPEEEVGQVRHLLERDPSAHEIEEFIAEPHDRVEHYLEIGASRTGEVVTTVFVRLTVVASALHIDFSAGALARPPEHYAIVDAYREHGAAALARAVLGAVLEPHRPFWDLWRLVQAPVLLVRGLRVRKDRTLVPRRGRAIGSRTSIREQVATRWRRANAAFDIPETNRHKNHILRAALDAIAEFLDSRGIDTSAFKSQITQIINASVLNMGKLDINNSAVGDNAQFNQTQNTAQPTTDEGSA